MTATKFYWWYEWADGSGGSTKTEAVLPGPTALRLAVEWLIDRLDNHTAFDSPIAHVRVEAVVAEGDHDGKHWEVRVPVTVR